MSAPRVWVWQRVHDGSLQHHWSDQPVEGATKYVRADIADAMLEALMMTRDDTATTLEGALLVELSIKAAIAKAEGAT